MMYSIIASDSLAVRAKTKQEIRVKIAHLIQTNKNPGFLKRRVNFLSSDDSAFFIHVDAKSDISVFSSIKGDNVFFSERRIPVYWGEYSMVDAVLLLIRQALASSMRFDYFLLSTGSDFPIRSKEYIHEFFDKNAGSEFIGAIKLPGGEPANPLLKRDPQVTSAGCARYAAEKRVNNHLNILRMPSDRPVSKFAVKIANRLGLARRPYQNYLKNMQPFAGNTHWALTRGACEYIINFVEDNRQVCNFFAGTFASDETIFHTIIGNSEFKTRIRRHLMFEDWSQNESGQRPGSLFERSSNKGGHPSWLDSGHIDYFEKNKDILINDIYGRGEVLFARKFSDSDLALVDRMEEIIKDRL